MPRHGLWLLPLLPWVGLAHAAQQGRYDVIVIGGGHVGTGVAARAAALLGGRRVLLLEAGGPAHYALGGRSPPGWWVGGSWEPWSVPAGSEVDRYDIPGNYPVMQCWDLNCSESWGRDKFPAFQCKILGGCGVMNGALMQRPPARTFEAWPAGWKLEDMSPYLDEVEGLYYITPTPSTDGQHYNDDTGAEIVRAALEDFGFTLSTSLTPRAGVFSVPQVAALDGMRQSAASVMLPPALELDNFEMRLHTEVSRVISSGGRATGVRVRREDGAEETILLTDTGVLVVSAGPLNTPRLLLTSGLDGEGHVGEQLTDHTLHMRKYKLPPWAEKPVYSLSPPSHRDLSQYLRDHSGPLAQYLPTLVAFFRDPDDEGTPEDYQVEMFLDPVSDEKGVLNANLVLMGPVCSRARAYLKRDGSLAWNTSLHSSCARDQKFLEFAGGVLDDILNRVNATLLHTTEVDMNHFAGTCPVGSCTHADTLILKGTQNIVVADASLLPNQIISHPAMLLKALSLRAAEIVARNVAANEAAWTFTV